MRGFFKIGLILFSLGLHAQDIHFSQFYASPLTLNPSLTGNFDGLARIGANYRNQWRSVTIPYNTVSAYADFNYLRDKIGRGDWLGSGIWVVNDFAGDGRLTVNKISVSTAYHKSLNKAKTLYLSIGLTGTVVQKKINFSALTFDSQWNDVGFDSNLNPGENYTGDQFWFFDLQVGASIFYSFENRFSLRTGFSMVHVNQPKESFLGSDNYIHRRPLGHLYSVIQIGPKFSVQPGLIYMYQRKAEELIAGLNLTYDHKYAHNKILKLYLGFWFRNKDAFFPVIGAEMFRTRLLLNYDINLSQLIPGSQTRGGIEISVVRTFDKKRSISPVRFCPRFF